MSGFGTESVTLLPVAARTGAVVYKFCIPRFRILIPFCTLPGGKSFSIEVSKESVKKWVSHFATVIFVLRSLNAYKTMQSFPQKRKRKSTINIIENGIMQP